jgi:single-strand DNA-binding protein
MYALKNKVQLIGNLGHIPQTGTTEKGKKWARFSIATHDNYRGANGEKINQTYWHNIVAWGKLAEIAEKYLTKGSEVAVEGKLVYRNYTDKNGVQRQSTDVLVSELLMLGSKNHE